MSGVFKSVITTLTGTVVGGVISAGIVSKRSKEKTAKVQEMSNKHLALFEMMNRWVRVKQEGKNLSSYFENNGYKKIAIYGMSYVGESLLSELKDTDIMVMYGIDKNASNMYLDIDVFEPDDNLEKVDVMVVTAITFFDEIEEKLSEKVDCPIISLEDVIFECL